MKMMVPLDGSAFAEAVLEKASALATSMKAEVHLIEVLKESEIHGTRSAPQETQHTIRGGIGSAEAEVHSRMVQSGGVGGAAESLNQAIDRGRVEATDYLESIVSRSFPGGAQITVAFGEDVAEEILKHARQQEVDFIAMATHGRTGLSRILVGSVSADLLKGSEIPLFLVRPQELH